METEREEDAGAAVHPPEEHSDTVLRRLCEVQIPQQHLPVERPAFDIERRANHLRLLTRLYMLVLDVFQCPVPVIAIAEIARGAFHLRLAPGLLPLRESNQLFRRVRDTFVLEFE